MQVVLAGGAAHKSVENTRESIRQSLIPIAGLDNRCYRLGIVNIRPAQLHLLEWYRHNKRELPWRQSRDPYRIWISETMLQQTTTTAVIPFFERFTTRFPDLATLAAAEQEHVVEAWAGLGYYSRARNLHASACEVHARGGFHRTYQELIELRGFGPYTARSVASLAFEAFSCEQFDDGTSHLIADYSVDCRDDAQYAPVKRLAVAAIILYPVAVPLTYALLLRAARGAILSGRATTLSRALAFLHQDIEPRCFMWEVAEIAKKTFLLGAVALIKPGTSLQLIVGFGFSLVFMLLSGIVDPYRQDSDDFFALVCNFVLTASLFLCFVLKDDVAFEQIDANKDGKITLAEFVGALHVWD